MAHNKFWGEESDSSSSSDSSSESDSPVANAATAGRAPAKRWAEQSSSDDDDNAPRKREVKSTTDKRFDQMQKAIKDMKNHMNIDDFASVTQDFEAILKMLERVKKLANYEGHPPSMFVQMLLRVEKFVEDTHESQGRIKRKEEEGKLLNQNRSTAFNTLRARIRKTLRNDFQELVDDAKENPDKYKVDEAAAASESDSSSSSSDSDSSGSGSSDSESSDSDSSDSSSSSGSSSGSSSASGSSGSSTDDEDAAREKKMLKWVITSKVQIKKDLKKAKWKIGDAVEVVGDQKELFGKESESLQESLKDHKELFGKVAGNLSDDKYPVELLAKDGKNIWDQDGSTVTVELPDTCLKKDERKKKKARGPTHNETAVAVGQDAATPAGQKKEKELTPEELRKKVSEIAAKRGRKGFDRKNFASELMELMAHAQKIGPLPQLHIYCSLVSADFDGAGHAFDAMKISLWNEAIAKVTDMLPLIQESHQAHIATGGDTQPEKAEEEEDGGSTHPRMQELFVHFIEQLDDELYKALQFTVDVYGSEYNDILANSSKFLILLRRALKFFENTNQSMPLGSLALRVIEHLHYKPDVLNKLVYGAIGSSMVPEEEKGEWVWPENSRSYIASLCQFVHDGQCDDEESMVDHPRMKKRASLCQAYHLALHNHFHEARDMLLLGNLWDKAMESEVHTQILYHRVVAQMGLCAFRIGKMMEAHSFLAELCMHNKARVLLAQGLDYNKNGDRTPQQERDERLRQLPYHMHINIEIMESAHHICAMLLEVPNLAMQSIDPTNKKIHSKVLRRALDYFDKQQFCGPPENNKEAVVTAAKALQKGEWDGAWQAIEDLKLWSHIVPGQNEAGSETKEQMKNELKEMVKLKIKETALRTYLFAYASIYDAFHLDRLVDMFKLPAHGPGSVHSIVSKMMIKEEITAFWHADEQESDQPKYYILMQHSEPTPLQRLALSLADKGAQAVDNNERLVTQKTGDFGFKDAVGQVRGYTSGQGVRRIGKGGGKGGFGGVGGKGGYGGKGGKGGKGGFSTSAPNAVVRDRGWGAARDIVRRRAA